VATVEQDPPAAIAQLDEAIAAAEAADMALHATVGRYRRAQLLGAAAGAGLLAEACASMAASNIRVPARWAGVYAPGRYPEG
jgi:hypothetical protein